MIYPATTENIRKAAERLKAGEVVAFPTETVYGLGANALNPSAVAKIFYLKNRPNVNPLIVHLEKVPDLEQVVDLSSRVELGAKLAKLSKLWPGALTLVLPKLSVVPEIVTAGLNSVAVRIPNHPVARELLKFCGCPLAAPSANLSTEVSTTSAEDVEHSFLGRVEMILDGGATTIGLESTVLSLLEDPPKVLRPGAITVEQLREILGEVTQIDSSESSSTPVSPGLHGRHYAPRTALKFFKDFKQEIPIDLKVGAISFSNDSPMQMIRKNCLEFITLSSDAELSEISRQLYSCLRELDGRGLDLILVDSCEPKGLGLAVMDRLRRASAKH